MSLIENKLDKIINLIDNDTLPEHTKDWVIPFTSSQVQIYTNTPANYLMLRYQSTNEGIEISLINQGGGIIIWKKLLRYHWKDTQK